MLVLYQSCRLSILSRLNSSECVCLAKAASMSYCNQAGQVRMAGGNDREVKTTL